MGVRLSSSGTPPESIRVFCETSGKSKPDCCLKGAEPGKSQVIFLREVQKSGKKPDILFTEYPAVFFIE